MDQLQASKLRLLEQHALLMEARDMVHELQAQQQQQQHKDPDHLLHTDGSKAGPAVASLARHLQAASLAQQLQLPSVSTAQQNPFTLLPEDDDRSSRAGGSDQHSELLGTQKHILGVTPQLLRQLNLPSRKAAQRAHAPLLPALEARLRQHAQTAVAVLAGPTPDTQEERGQPLQQVTDSKAALVQCRAAILQGLKQLGTEAAAYLQELEGLHVLLQELVGRCMVQEQAKIAQVSRAHLIAHTETCIGKLQLMQLQLRSEAYNPDNIRALEVISQEQQQSEQELLDAVEQAELALQEYQQLGPDFQDVVGEYGQVKRDCCHVDDLIQTLTAVEDDMQASSRYS